MAVKCLPPGWRLTAPDTYENHWFKVMRDGSQWRRIHKQGCYKGMYEKFPSLRAAMR